MAGFILLAVLHTYPLAWHLDSHLPGTGLGDNVSFVWNQWWMREALASSRIDFFHSDHLMWPHGVPLVLHTHTALMAFVGATALGGFSIVEAQNILVIGAVALNGLAAFALALEISGSRSGASLAGVLYLLAAPLAARLMGHFNLLTAWPLVLGCWATVRAVRNPSVPNACAVAITAAVTVYADYYLAVFLLSFILLYVATELWTLRMSGRRAHVGRPAATLIAASALLFAIAAAIAIGIGGKFYLADLSVSATRPQNAMTAGWLLAVAAALVIWRPRVRLVRRGGIDVSRAVRCLVLAAVLCAVVLWPIGRAAWQVRASGDYVTSTAALKSSPRGVDVATLVMGPPFHGIAGSHVRAAYTALGIDAMESSAWLGIVPVTLALWAIAGGWKEPEVRRWTLVALVFFVWSLGPYALVLGHDTGLLLPQAVAQLVPMLDNARIPGRALIVVSLALSILAALGIRHLRRRQAATALLLASLAFVESSAAPLPLAGLPVAGAVERRLAEAHGRTAVLPVPFGVRDGFGSRGSVDHGGLYLQTVHGAPLAGGFVARVPPRISSWYELVEPFAALLGLSQASGGKWVSCAAAVEGLRTHGIGFVVVERAAAPEEAVRFLRSLPLESVARDGSRELFVLRERAICGEQGERPN